MKLIATQQREWSYRWNDAHAPTLWAKDAFGTIKKEVNKPVYVFTKQSVSRKTRKRAAVSLRRPCFAALFKRDVVVVVDRCRKSLMASARLLQVGGCTERHAKAKNFTVSSNACRADRKVRMTPPRSFSLSRCDAHSRCTSEAGTTHRLTVTGACNER